MHWTVAAILVDATAIWSLLAHGLGCRKHVTAKWSTGEAEDDKTRRNNILCCNVCEQRCFSILLGTIFVFRSAGCTGLILKAGRTILPERV